MIVDFPDPDGPDEEDELALLDHERRLAQGHDVRLVDLRHALEDDHRRAGRRRGGGAGSPFTSGLRRRLGGFVDV